MISQLRDALVQGQPVHRTELLHERHLRLLVGMLVLDGTQRREAILGELVTVQRLADLAQVLDAVTEGRIEASTSVRAPCEHLA